MNIQFMMGTKSFKWKKMIFMWLKYWQNSIGNESKLTTLKCIETLVTWTSRQNKELASCPFTYFWIFSTMYNNVADRIWYHTQILTILSGYYSVNTFYSKIACFVSKMAKQTVLISQINIQNWDMFRLNNNMSDGLFLMVE